MREPYIVGITGGSGSGKTRVLRWLKKLLAPHDLCPLSQDNYYHDWLPAASDKMYAFNFDAPQVIDVERFAKDLTLLKNGTSVQCKEYAFNNPEDEAKLLEFHPAPVIVVEGIFIFHYPEIKEQLDLKVFVDVKEHLKLERRLTRDIRERGYPLEDILYKYTKQVAPAYEKYIEPYRHEADIIIPNNQFLEENCPLAIEILGTYLKNKYYE